MEHIIYIIFYIKYLTHDIYIYILSPIIKLCSCFNEFSIENQNLFIERFNSIRKEILKQFYYITISNKNDC